ncbi:MAG: PLP-dependent aminotransferase family protein [Rhodocyclaceae bacterium]
MTLTVSAPPRQTPSNRLEIALQRRNGARLVDQLVQGIRHRVRSGALHAGARLPSIRTLSEQLKVSTYTVADAYDTLVALNEVESRPGAGYFVKRAHAFAGADGPVCELPVAIPCLPDDNWMSAGLFDLRENVSAAGCGWLPSDWFDTQLLREAMRKTARLDDPRLTEYGSPAGYLPLREQLAQTFSEQFCPVSPQQIITTNGAMHALELLVRALLRPGDTVLVEDPTYWNVLALFRSHGCTVVPVARDEHGLDLAAFESLARRHRPRLAFITTVLNNPLSQTLSHAQAHRLLAIAERENLLLIEDDIFRAFDTAQSPCLAGMDGLQRVFQVGGFSKCVSPALRVGYIVAPARNIPRLTRCKMTCGLTSSQLNESTTLHVITDSAYRRHLKRLQCRALEAQDQLERRLIDAGLTLLAKPQGGLFVSAGWMCPPRDDCNAISIAREALDHGIALAPADYFHSGASRSIWFRFNAGHAISPRVFDFLAEQSQRLHA